MICSKNSFLYRINDWVDANAFFTVGKGMVRGIVPYRDIFEQKGPLLYFIYGLGSLISYRSFIGVFILEVFFFSVFLYYSQKIACLFLSQKCSNFILPIFALGVVTLKAFSHGGSAEEFTLPFLMISCYYLIVYLQDESICISKKTIFLNGILAGCIFWIKYTLIGFLFGWMACIFLIQVLHNEYKDAFRNCLYFLLGMFVATIPWLVYFCFHGALDDLWNVYFMVNMNAYPVQIGMLQKLNHTVSFIFESIFGNVTMCIGTVGGFLLLFLKRDIFAKREAFCSLLFCFFTTGFFIYIGGTNYHYYSLPMSIFLLFGLIFLFSFVDSRKFLSRFLWSSLICLILVFSFSSNTRMIFYKEDNYAQYEFASIINQVESPTLLNYGFLDGGFYLTTGIQPKMYYFMKNNIPYQNYPEMMNTQDYYVKERLFDFIVIKGSLSRRKKEFISQYYEMVSSHTQTNNLSQTITYILYQRKY